MGLFDAFIRGTEFFSGSTEYKVKVTSDGEMAVTSTERERNNALHYQVSAVAASAYHILIDLSDTTNFPHDSTGRIDISLINLSIEKSLAGVIGRIRLGVITRVDGTDADISYLYGLAFLKGQSQYVNQIINYAPSQLKFATGRYLTNSNEAAVAAVNTGLTLPTPFGVNATPAVGDVVIKSAYTSGGNYDFDIELMYHSEA